MLSLILTLALIGFIVYLITTYVPMPSIMRTVIYVVVAVFVIVWLMQALGVSDVPVPQLK
jgi:predicted membrane channel-forming protein YqfA (hemolysin III family)